MATKKKFGWDEVSCEWYGNDKIEPGGGWKFVKKFGPVKEFRSDQGHLAIEVMAKDKDEANILALKHHEEYRDQWAPEDTADKRNDVATPKPQIICMSKNNDTTFKWMSIGWGVIKKRQTERFKKLFEKAKKAIEDGKNVPDAIKRLEKSGFIVKRGK